MKKKLNENLNKNLPEEIETKKSRLSAIFTKEVVFLLCTVSLICLSLGFVLGFGVFCIHDEYKYSYVNEPVSNVIKSEEYYSEAPENTTSQSSNETAYESSDIESIDKSSTYIREEISKSTESVANVPSNNDNVYITPSGSKYHFSPDCGGKNSYEVTLEEAIKDGKTPCKKCAQ